MNGWEILAATFVGMALTASPVLAADPHEESKEARDARMQWWRDAKFGMFIHWGLYAKLAGVWNGREVPGLGEWIQQDVHIPVADYRRLAETFDPRNFDAEKWVSLAKAAGMKYIVITAKHHDGFAMFGSAHPFNIVEGSPFHRDPLLELAKACKRQGVKLGFYYSQDQDWTEPGGGAMRGHWDAAQDGDFAKYFREKAIPQVKELLENYPDAPAVLWFDTPSDNMTPELAGEMIEVLKARPGIIINDRLGGGWSGDTSTPEQYVPPMGFPGRDWETCMTINDTWGFKKDDQNWKSAATLLRNLIDIVSKGGNYLLNVGPTDDGVIPEPEAARLREMGRWLSANGESIYGTSASPFPRPISWGRVTQKGARLYLHVFDWPADGRVTVPMKNSVSKAFLPGSPGRPLATRTGDDGVTIEVPDRAPDPVASVIAVDVNGPVDPLPPAAARANGEGVLTLSAVDAVLENAGKNPVTARLEERGGELNIGYWTDSADSASWKMEVPKSGRYRIVVSHAGIDDAKFQLRTGSRTVDLSLPATGAWENFATSEAGIIDLREGAQEITLTPAAESAGNLRSIRFEPVSD